jgi:hypothetical protein
VLRCGVCVHLRGLRFLSAVLAFLISAVAAQAETLDWNYPGATISILSATSNTTVNGVTITSTGTESGGFTTRAVQILGAGSSNGSSTGIGTTTMNATTDNLTSFLTYTVSFSEPVYNVSFTVLDIDGGPAYSAGNWNDIVDFSSNNGFPSAVITNSAWVSYSAATGRASAISNQNAVNGNANQSNGNIRLTFAGPITTFSIRHYAGPMDASNDPAGQVIYIDDVTFTRSPRLQVNKQALGNTGSFPLAVNNVLNTTTTPMSSQTLSQTLNVSPAGATATGTQRILFATNTATTITETVPLGWAFNASTMACSDSNSANSGNPANFTASVSSNTVVVAAANVRAGAIITCTVVNTAAIQTASLTKSWAFATPGGDVNGNGLADVGDQIVYSYLVENTGNVTLSSVVVNDIHEGSALPTTPSRVVTNETLILNGSYGPSTDGATNGTWDTLTPGSRVRFTYPHTVTLTEFNAG